MAGTAAVAATATTTVGAVAVVTSRGCGGGGGSGCGTTTSYASPPALAASQSGAPSACVDGVTVTAYVQMACQWTWRRRAKCAHDKPSHMGEHRVRQPAQVGAVANIPMDPPMVKIDTTTKHRHDASMSPADSLHTRQRRSNRACERRALTRRSADAVTHALVCQHTLCACRQGKRDPTSQPREPQHELLLLRDFVAASTESVYQPRANAHIRQTPHQHGNER